MIGAAGRTVGGAASAPRATRVPIVLALTALLSVVGFGVSHLFDAFQIIDDAYFYARYAHNLLTEGELVWNVGEHPVFGPTSLAWTLWLTPFVAAWPDQPALALLAGSATAAFAFLIALGVLVVRSSAPGLRAAVLLLVGFVIAANTREFAALVTNAMDTQIALLFLALLLLSWVELDRRPCRRTAIVAGICGGLAFAARPDLLLFAFTIPAAHLVFDAGSERRRAAGIACAMTALVLAAQLVTAASYFGTPLPLSFYAKSTRFFGAEMYAMFAHVPARELVLFASSYAILFAIVATDWILGPKRAWRDSSALEKGIALATVGFLAYYLLFVLQMMGTNRRFYYPTLPALAWLATRSLHRLLGDSIASWRAMSAACPIRVRWLGCALVVLASLPAVRAVLGHEPSKRARAEELGRFDLRAMHDMVVEPPVWFGMNALAELDGLTLATTEVGMIGVVCRDHRIVDLSGLNDTWSTQGEFSADWLFGDRAPDVIYMVFPTFAAIDRAIRAHPSFRSDYELFEVGTGVAVRRDSPARPVIAALVAARNR